MTGANRGIGIEVCRQLATLGSRVFLTARNDDKGAATAAELADDGLVVEFVQLDVTDPASVSGDRRVPAAPPPTNS